MAYSFKIDEETLNGLKNALKGKKRILLSTHRSPDGDAIGSSLAMYHFLKEWGHEVVISVPDPAPAFLHWLPGHEEIIVYKNNKEAFAEICSHAEIIFALDYNHFARTGDELGELLQASTALKIMIDHHQEPDESMEYKVWDVEASSTAQLVYDTILALSGSDAITKDIGECLYTGIMTDTGSFRFATCSSHTMRIVAHLLDCGVDGNQIHQLVYDQNSIDRLHLMGYALEKMVLIADCHTAYISLSSKELRKFNYQAGDTEGLVNKALSVQGVKVAALLTEKEGSVRLSLRSSAAFSVNDFSRKYFNGGGHYHAAGGTFNGSMEEAAQHFEKYIHENKDEIALA
jgi:phosphoesterase RecJ-like protein